MIKLCTFDLDGTVLDTVKTIAYYGNLTLKNYGFSEIETEKYKHLAGNGAKVLVERMLSEKNAFTKENFDKAYKFYVENYDKDVLYKTTIFEGMKENLDLLKKDGVKIAIISNKPHYATQTVVNTMFGEGYFDFVYGQKEGVPLKPDPVMLLNIMDELGIKKDECVYVGDTYVDMENAKNADVTAIGVLWGFRDREELENSGADVIVERPLEIYEYVKKAR